MRSRRSHSPGSHCIRLVQPDRPDAPEIAHRGARDQDRSTIEGRTGAEQPGRGAGVRHAVRRPGAGASFALRFVAGPGRLPRRAERRVAYSPLLSTVVESPVEFATTVR